ncbi:unnamed protein product [Linum tenue]|uniref:Uncharacterized protein n=1 Tax=Linum tenue TaxID=586396 RepID=A0AAV0I5B0_9ROSI|nr:unnamed protein product [Linum tenue]
MKLLPFFVLMCSLETSTSRALPISFSST